MTCAGSSSSECASAWKVAEAVRAVAVFAAFRAVVSLAVDSPGVATIRHVIEEAVEDAKPVRSMTRAA